jgi:hypothetical protein
MLKAMQTTEYTNKESLPTRKIILEFKTLIKQINNQMIELEVPVVEGPMFNEDYVQYVERLIGQDKADIVLDTQANNLTNEIIRQTIKIR